MGVVYGLTKKLPSSERYGLASQMQRAAISTMSNIAEGFERGTTKGCSTPLYLQRHDIVKLLTLPQVWAQFLGQKSIPISDLVYRAVTFEPAGG